MADKVTVTERYFDKEGNLVAGIGEEVDAEKLKGATAESKIGKLAAGGAGEPSPVAPKPVNTAGKKPNARTRAKTTAKTRAKPRR